MQKISAALHVLVYFLCVNPCFLPDRWLNFWFWFLMAHWVLIESPVLYLIVLRCVFKGTVSRDFLLLIFLWISIPPAPEYPIRTVLNFFENSRRYSQVKVHHRYQWHRRQICHRYQRHRRQILPPVPLVLLIPVANLPPVSTTLVANCHRYQWHRWQIIRTISGCRHLKVNLKAKLYIC